MYKMDKIRNCYDTIHCIILCSLFSLALSNENTFDIPLAYQPKILDENNNGAGKPLMLTPYINEGKVELAQNISRVPLTENIGFRSHAGFITVDQKYNSNLFIWYFPAFNKDENAPVILWLQGGPGGSSLFGLFTENGPLLATNDGVSIRKYHWALKYNLIYIDNPVGTGFSFTNEDGYCTNEQCVAQGLYNCLQQFFLMFENLRNNEFYIAGESYAGKFVSSLGMKIHNQNMNTALKINLRGLSFGNALCDPINQIDYGNYLYQHGLIDDKQRTLFNKMQDLVAEQVRKGNWEQATVLRDLLIHGRHMNFSFFEKFTGFENYYNYLRPKHTPEMSMYKHFLNGNEVRRSIHVGGLPFNSGHVRRHLISDIMKSVAPLISELLSYYRLMFYNGQLDVVVAYPFTVNFLHKLNFSSADEYKNAPRKIWRVDDEIAGYYKHAGNITEVLVRNAGHMVPHDQPKWAFNLITRFIENNF